MLFIWQGRRRLNHSRAQHRNSIFSAPLLFVLEEGAGEVINLFRRRGATPTHKDQIAFCVCLCIKQTTKKSKCSTCPGMGRGWKGVRLALVSSLS